MRIDNDWIYFADIALKKSGIVTPENTYPEEFKGYISSLGAAIVQMGLYPALLVYESDESKAAHERFRLPWAVLYMFSSKDRPESCVNNSCGILDDAKDLSLLLDTPLSIEYKLSDQYANYKNKEQLSKLIEKALVYIKLAIRMYAPVKKLVLGKWHKVYKTLEINGEHHTDGVCKRACPNTNSNIGWLFYRDYYRNYTCKKIIKDNEEHDVQAEVFLKEKNPYILSSSLTGNGGNLLKHNIGLFEFLKNKQQGFECLTFRTTNPGLLIGTGLTHGTKVENDFKCGFQFDYTTGLPYIPGSSVKGVLRSMFPFKGDEKEDLKYYYINSLLQDEDNKILDSSYNGIKFSKEEIENLAHDIFVHEGEASYDIFMDAIITGCGTKDGTFLSDDFITPQHENPFGDPNPIQFIKVLPNIEFTFFFKLTECKCHGVDINLKNLFKCILEDIGVGAKTNVGYGQLKFVR